MTWDPDEGGPSLYPEDAERGGTSELPYELQTNPEQIITSTSLTPALPGDTIINDPHVSITEKRFPSLGVYQDKGKQYTDNESYMEGPISTQMSEQSLESQLEHISRDFEVLKGGMYKWVGLADHTTHELEAQLAEQDALRQQISYALECSSDPQELEAYLAEQEVLKQCSMYALEHASNLRHTTDAE